MTMELSKVKKKILKDIALNGDKTIYDIAVKDKIAARSTVSKAFDKFQELDLVEVKREEPFPKIKENVKRYYGLTFRGLIAALKIEDVKLDQVENRVDLVLSWVTTVKKIDSIIGLTANASKTERRELYRAWEDSLIYYMTNLTEKGEKFFRHFDIDYSEDRLIFIEFNSEVQNTMLGLAVRSSMNEQQKREYSRKLKSLKQLQKYALRSEPENKASRTNVK